MSSNKHTALFHLGIQFVMFEILFCLVVGVIDGDTIKVRCGLPSKYVQQNVRVIAIDAPESKDHRWPAQPFNQRSREHLRDLCLHTTAKLTIHYRDQFQRPVADVECNGVDAGAEQVRAGMAWVYPRYARKHQGFYVLQETAKTGRVGLWVDSKPVPPWEWRKGRRE